MGDHVEAGHTVRMERKRRSMYVAPQGKLHAPPAPPELDARGHSQMP